MVRSKTSLRLDPALKQASQKLALAEGKTFTDIVEEGLRLRLRQARRAELSKPANPAKGE